MSLKEQKMEKKITYTDTYSGEVLCEKTYKVNSSFDYEKGYLFWNRKNASKTFKDVQFPESMTFDEIGRLTVLTKYIYSNTNMLGYRGNGIVKPFSMSDIGKIIKLSDRYTQRYVKKLIDLGVMARVKITTGNRTEYQYYINPLYFFSSNWMPLNLYLLFRNQLDKYLPKWVISKFMEQDGREEE
jgi:hypothetical protein